MVVSRSESASRSTKPGPISASHGRWLGDLAREVVADEQDRPVLEHHLAVAQQRMPSVAMSDHPAGPEADAAAGAAGGHQGTSTRQAPVAGHRLAALDHEAAHGAARRRLRSRSRRRPAPGRPGRRPSGRRPQPHDAGAAVGEEVEPTSTSSSWRRLLRRPSNIARSSMSALPRAPRCRGCRRCREHTRRPPAQQAASAAARGGTAARRSSAPCRAAPAPRSADRARSAVRLAEAEGVADHHLALHAERARALDDQLRARRRPSRPARAGGCRGGRRVLLRRGRRCASS